MDREEAAELLERQRSIRTLLALLNAPDERTVSDLLDDVGGSRSTGINRLDELRSTGLVQKRAGNNRTLYTLTTEGKEVAEQLQATLQTIQAASEENNEHH